MAGLKNAITGLRSPPKKNQEALFGMLSFIPNHEQAIVTRATLFKLRFVPRPALPDAHPPFFLF